jgi:ribosomal protein S18 acetylase RimI-like enzyme
MLKHFGIQIRNLNVDDVNPVYKLGCSIFDWPTEQILWNEQIVRWYYEQSKAVCFVAEKESLIIGFILCFATQSKGRVEWVAVNGMFQKQGVATELLRRALIVFKLNNITEISTLAREDEKANTFFSKNKFQNCGLRKIEMSLNTLNISKSIK